MFADVMERNREYSQKRTRKFLSKRTAQSKEVHSIFDSIQVAVSKGHDVKELLSQLEEACKK